MARIYDVTLPLRPDLPTWPGEPAPRRAWIAAIDRGDPANVSTLFVGLHAGTHVDAPLHFWPDGGGIETIPLDALVGPARVIAIDPAAATIGPAELARHDLAGVERILFKTRNSAFWDTDPATFRTDFVGLSLAGAEDLIARGIRLIGIDYLSIEPYQNAGHPVHRRLLAARAVILEGVDLRAVPPGDYALTCLPLLVPGAEGAPARVILQT